MKRNLLIIDIDSGAGNGESIYFLKLKGSSGKMINFNTVTNYSITLELSNFGSKTKVKINRIGLKQDKITYNCRK